MTSAKRLGAAIAQLHEITRGGTPWLDAEDAKRLVPVMTEIAEAIEPFIKTAKRIERDYPDYGDSVGLFFELTHGDFRRLGRLAR